MSFRRFTLLLSVILLCSCERAGLIPLSDPSLPSPSPTPTATPTPSPTVSPVAFVSRTVATCPLDSTWCSTNWPSSSDGQMYLYQFRETRPGTGETLDRTAYVYVPTRITAPSPVFLFLHGGTSSGVEMLDTTRFAFLADQRGISVGATWRKNTSTCRYKADSLGAYENISNSNACIPPQVTYNNSQAYILILPDGVADANSVGANPPRHWEDGRVPSPGFDTTEQHRDDVAFINQVLASVRLQEGSKVDSQRIYVGGASNGGMMTSRLICNSSKSEYPELQNVAAFAMVIASVPEALAKGLNGRENCPAASSPRSTPILMMVGKDVPTPNCSPYGCTSPTVSGDKFMPYGSAGSSYLVASPDSGLVVSSADAQSLILSILGGSSSATLTQTNIGYYTVTKKWTWSGSASPFLIYETTGARHESMATRMDFVPAGQILNFVFGFKRVNGVITTTASGITGDI